MSSLAATAPAAAKKTHACARLTTVRQSGTWLLTLQARQVPGSAERLRWSPVSGQGAMAAAEGAAAARSALRQVRAAHRHTRAASSPPSPPAKRNAAGGTPRAAGKARRERTGRLQRMAHGGAEGKGGVGEGGRRAESPADRTSRRLFTAALPRLVRSRVSSTMGRALVCRTGPWYVAWGFSDSRKQRSEWCACKASLAARTGTSRAAAAAGRRAGCWQ